MADIKENIHHIRDLLEGRTLNEISSRVVERAALERFLEVISEASRHLPEEWKAEHPQIPWRRLADIGNIMRHAYAAVDLSILWGVYERDLTPLEASMDAMLAAHGQ